MIMRCAARGDDYGLYDGGIRLELPWGLIGKVSSRIVNEVKNVNRVLYDCTGKPPATIEFE